MWLTVRPNHPATVRQDTSSLREEDLMCECRGEDLPEMGRLQ